MNPNLMLNIWNSYQPTIHERLERQVNDLKKTIEKINSLGKEIYSFELKVTSPDTI